VIRHVARRWWPVLALLLLLLVLQGRFWFGDRGWREAEALQDTVTQQRAENARLQQRNDALGAEVEDLKSGETAVEERARSELGMVKPGETFYRVVEPHDQGDTPANAAVAAPPAAATGPATADAHAATPQVPATSQEPAP
jgi:cell division protein FtsB